MAREKASVSFTCCGYDEMSPESQKAVRELVEIVAAESDPSLLSDEEQAQYAGARRSVVEARDALPSTPQPADQQEGEHRGS